MMISKFTYRYLEKIIEVLEKNEYIISNYHNHDLYSKVCIMRHDVDYDVSKALEFADFESKHRINSTYFLLLSSDFYNIFSPTVLTKIDKIRSLGHEIGLHFDETKYDFQGNKEKFRHFVEEELAIMSKAIGEEIKSVSMHRPSKFSLENDLVFSEVINSYSKEFFRDFKYISDSRMNWREDIISVIESGEYDKIHLLTHPFWYSKCEENTRKKLLSYFKSGSKFRYEIMSKNFRDIDEFVKMEDVI
jgi:hypothetical protein